MRVASDNSDRAGEAPKGTKDSSASCFEQQCATLITAREPCGGTAPGSEEVVQFLQTAAFHDGKSIARESLDPAVEAGGLDIADLTCSERKASKPLSVRATNRESLGGGSRGLCSHARRPL